MGEAKSSGFFERLLEQNASWKNLHFSERAGDGWRGIALVVPPPAGSDIVIGLDIEEVGGEITISFDHTHIHLDWPPRPSTGPADIWADPLLVIDAILNERVVALSGWIGERFRVGSLRLVENTPDRLASGIEHIRVRSWLGTFDRDMLLSDDTGDVQS